MTYTLVYWKLSGSRPICIGYMRRCVIHNETVRSGLEHKSYTYGCRPERNCMTESNIITQFVLISLSNFDVSTNRDTGYDIQAPANCERKKLQETWRKGVMITNSHQVTKFLVNFCARQHICYSAYMLSQFWTSGRLDVWTPHGWISQKRLKLGSCNFHHRVAP